MATDEFRIRWRAVSIIVGLLYLASLTVLVIVVAVDEVDLLATVALALAVLAFAGQVVGNVVQDQSTSQQLLQGERVNNEVQDALAELRDHIAELITGSEARVEKLMEHLVSDAIPSAVRRATEARAFDVVEFETSLLAKLQASTEISSSAPAPPDG